MIVQLKTTLRAAICSIGVLGASATVSASAQSIEVKAIEEKRLQKGSQALSEDRAYIYISAPTRANGIFIKTADADELAEFEAEWREEFDEAVERYPRKLERWKDRAKMSRNPGERPVEPTEQNFSIGSIESRLMASFGPQYVFNKGKRSNGEKFFEYVMEVEPGEYTYYGPMFMAPNGAVVGVCYCMGSVKFEAKAGEVTSLGDFLWLGWASHDLLAMTTVMRAGFTDRPVTPVDWSVPDSLSALPSAPAELFAAGKMNNFFRAGINRMPPVEGVLAYERDVVIDVKAQLAAEAEAAARAEAEAAAAALAAEEAAAAAAEAAALAEAAAEEAEAVEEAAEAVIEANSEEQDE